MSWGEVIGATRLFIGAVEEDSSGYPDCRPAFYDAFNRVIEFGTKPETNITIETPIITLSKQDVVRKGLDLEAPFELTGSCYPSENEACGICAAFNKPASKTPYPIASALDIFRSRTKRPSQSDSMTFAESFQPHIFDQPFRAKPEACQQVAGG